MKPQAFYNEHDPRAAEWLRELIKRGAIAPGVVDERSIEDIAPSELDGFTQIHWFAGIGGWSAALRMAGWPDGREVVTGSCPCQPFSVGGKGEGVADKRHLWPAFKWHIAQRRPSVLFGEQVASKLGRDWLAGVRLDLEDMGYEVGAADLCGASGPTNCELGILRGDALTWERGTIRSPHIRQRLWWLAVTKDAHRWPELEQGSAGSWGARPSGDGAHGRLGAAESHDQRGGGRRVQGLGWTSTAGRSGHGSTAVIGLADVPVEGLEKRGALGGIGESQTALGSGTLSGVAESSGIGRGARGDNDREHDGSEPDANGNACPPGQQQPWPGPDQPTRPAAADHSRMDNSTGTRCAGTLGVAEGPPRDGARVQMPSAGCPANGMEHTDSSGREPGDAPTEGAGHGASSGPASGHGGVEHAALSERERLGPFGIDLSGPTNPWWNFYLCPCQDGKTRRIGTGIQPLAHGLPGRVGLLRGYGNAIIPKKAEDFVRAYLEVEEERRKNS